MKIDVYKPQADRVVRRVDTIGKRSGWLGVCLLATLLCLGVTSTVFGQVTDEQAVALRQKLTELQALRRERLDLTEQISPTVP